MFNNEFLNEVTALDIEEKKNNVKFLDVNGALASADF